MASPSIGERSNNPLNIRYSDANAWEGQIGSDSGFVAFDSINNGLRAGSKVLNTYGNKYGVNTIRGAISRFAPPTENDTENYVSFISSELGLDPDAPVDLTDPETNAKFVAAMAKMETGQRFTPAQVTEMIASAGQQGTDPIAALVAAPQPAQQPARRVGAPSAADLAISSLTAQEPPLAASLVEGQKQVVDRPTTFQETVERGFDSGVAGMQASGQYFKALLGTLVKDDQMVADNIRRAQAYDEEAAQALSSSTEFKEFWDAPDFEKGIEQAGLAIGQVAPYAVTTILGALATGGSSVLAQLAGKGVISGVNKYAARRIIKEAAENVIQDVATPDEKTLVNSLFKTFKRGAQAGAFGASYVPLAGQNFSEGLQSGKEPDADLAIRSLLVAAPQAALDVAGETLLLQSFVNVAKRKAAKDGSDILGEFAKDVAKATGKGVIVEGTTEAGQEGIGALNRADMDEQFTAEEGWMRVAQGAFMGAIGGGAMGGAGGAMSGSVRATKGVFTKAQQYIRDAQEQRTNADLDTEQYGTFSGYTTEEPQADIEGQLDAMFNKDSAKTAVWVAGDINPSYRSVLPEDNTVYSIDIDGKRASAAFIPGRGVIIGRKKVVQAVVDAGASDQALQTALGYSALKPDDSTLVVQALDEKGRVISEEATNAAGLAAATAAATALSPNSTTRTLSLKDALADRKKRLDAERGPIIRGMDVSTDGDTQGEFESEVIESTNYQPRNTSRDAEGGFENTAQVRDEFASVFGDEMDIDFNLPFYRNMSESLMKSAIRLKNDNPTEFVSVTINPDLTYQLRLESTPETETVTVQDNRTSRTETISSPSEGAIEAPATVRQVPVTKFLAETIQKARKSQFANEGAVLITPDGQSIPVNMADLTNAGKRLAEARDRGGFQEGGPVQAARRGVLAILSELGSRGYDLQINNVSALKDEGVLRRSSIIVDTTGGNDIKLYQVFARKAGMQPRTPRQRETDSRTPLDRPEQFADQGSESEVMAESSFPGEDPRDGLPLSRLNLEMDPRYQSRARGGKPGRTSPFREATYPAGKVGELAVQIINRAVNAIRLAKPVAVFGVRELSGMSMGDIRAMFNDPRVANEVIRQLVELRDNPAAKGRYIGFNNAHFILVDNRTGSELEVALTAAHELGHAILEEERNATLSNKSLRARMERAFNKAKTAEGAPEAYQGELGFEEWYADQVAIWAQKLYLGQKRAAKPPKGQVENHFKQIAQRIINMFNAMSAEMKRRFGRENVDPQFEAYMDTVINSARRNREAAYQRSAAREATYEQKAIVRALNSAMPNRAVQFTATLRKRVAETLRNPNVRDAWGFVGTADGILRNINPKIANMFYTLAQSGKQRGNLGFVRQSTLTTNEWMGKVEKLLGVDWESEEVVKAFEEAAGDLPTDQLTGKARGIRLLLEQLYDDYIAPVSGSSIQKRPNYFPVALDLAKIYEDPDAFIGAILAHDSTASAGAIRTVVDGLVARQQYVLDEKEVVINGIDPVNYVEKARMLTQNVPPSVLAQFTLSPDQAMTKYIKDMVKRVEFDRATKDENGVSKLDPLLSSLSPRDRSTAEKVIKTYLGYTTEPLSPAFRTLNSWGQFVQMVQILPLAALSSIPELAGAVINAKDFSAVTMAMKNIVKTVRNQQEAMELARDIGLSSSTAISNLFMSEADSEFLDANVRDLSDKFFKGIGLDFFTRFTRMFAVNMGQSFLLAHAYNKSNNPRSTRYLDELGLTADEVKAWERDGRSFNSEAGKKVKSALQQFVENSMLRPNAAERPLWASDPRFALIWQLKGYFYSFGKVTLGGIKREMGQRVSEANGNSLAALSGIGALMALTAVAYLPLAMLGLELREYAKYGIAWVLPGVEPDETRYFKSDRMDWPSYANEMFDRSGLYGPMALLTMAGQQAEWGDSAFVSLLGPSAEMVESVFKDGFKAIPDRILPLYTLVY